jgi:hypothetical protein
MCAQCDEIDGMVARYRKVRDSTADAIVQEGMEKLIALLELQKQELHPGKPH